MEPIKPGNNPETGNPTLRYLTPTQASNRFRAQLIGDPQLKDRYYRWLQDYQDMKATMGADFRAVTGRSHSGDG